MCRLGSGQAAAASGGAGGGQASLGPCTYFIPWGQVLVLVAGVPFFPVQEEEIDHLLLVLPVEGEMPGKGQQARCPLLDGDPGATVFPPTAHHPPLLPAGPHVGRTPRTAGPVAACCGLGSSPASACCPAHRGRCPPGWAASGSVPFGGWAVLAQARSCPLCGRQGTPPVVTDLGRPKAPSPQPFLGTLSPAALSLSQPLHTSCTLLCPAQACRESLSAGLRLGAGLRWAGSSRPPSLAGPLAAATGKAGDEWEEKLLTYTICVSECALATRERNRKLVWREQGAHVRRPEGAGAGSTWGGGRTTVEEDSKQEEGRE